jgi:predicted ATP-dependent endonuclease of OLD family
MFQSLLGKVAKFGGVGESDTGVKIASTLQHRELLEGNTTVVYSQGDHELPENYNGLGYMNLISMIFEIEVLLAEFRCSTQENPAAINLLYIEEPEAHTHPQMQYVFIKNIKALLEESRTRDDGIVIQLQTAISTHSAHIVSESDFDDIKYLKKNAESNSVESKNLKALEDEYSSDEADY